MTFTAIVVDDEPLALDLISAILEDSPDVQIVATCSNGYDAVRAVLEHGPDLLFLDIEMPEMNGFDVIKAIQADIMPKVIFTTAYSHYAVEAFKVQALNYVLKPLDDEKVHECIARAKQALGTPKVASGKSKMLSVIESLSASEVVSETEKIKPLIVKDTDKFSFLNKKDIRWIEADGDYVCIYVSEATHLIRTTLKSIEQQLAGANFQRIHRGTIINLDEVKELHPVGKGEAVVTMKTGQKLKVSRSYGPNLRKKLI